MSTPGDAATISSLAGVVEFAERDGDRVAITDRDGEFTLSEMVERAGGVAARLADQREPVVVLTSYSRHSIAAMFGVALAGRGIVPLDPDQPRARLEALVERVGNCAVLDATGTVSGEVAGRPVLDALSMAPRRFAPIAVDPSTVSTIFFTSGSTGVPKGVRQTFADKSVALTRWARAQQVGSDERVAVFMPPNFAGGFAGAVLGLASGRSAVLLDPRQHDPQWLIEFLDARDVNRGTMTPSLARSIAESSGGRRFETLRLVNVTGEALEWSDVAVVRRVLPDDGTIRMAYGASETLGLVAVTHVRPGDELGVGRVPLGVPQPDVEFRLDGVDPATGRGELVVRRHVVDGYWDDPELTAQRFGVDPDGVRFWRSGDLIRIDEHGVMHHCGRSDDMIKANGRLIEPAEVERALASIPGVRRSVVLPRTLASGRTQVVGHLEVDDGATPDGVRSALRELLPEYLVPAVFVRHEHMPITERGKVDRQSLRTGAVTPWRSAVVVESDDALVAAVSAVVKQVLGIDHLDPDDVLWDIGCDSLSAMEIVAALLDTHPGRLEPNDLLTASTARDLAQRLSGGTGRRRSHVLTMNTSGTRPPLFLVGGGGSPALSYRAMVSALGADQPVVIFEQIGMHDDAPPVADIDETARRNLEHVRAVRPTGPYVLAGHSWGGLVAHRMATDLAAAGESVRLVLLDTAYPSREAAANSVAYRRLVPGMPRWFRRFEMGAIDLARAVRQVVPARPGTERYYAGFWLRAVRATRRHKVPRSEVPIVVVQPAGSPAAASWSSTHRVTTVTVGGNHRTMVHREHIEPALEHLRT